MDTRERQRPHTRRRTRTGLVTKRATCPGCGETVTYREQAGVRRFQPRLKRCPGCDEVFR